MSGPPSFKRPTPPVPAMPKKAPPKAKTKAETLAEMGGRTFTSGTRWVARLHRQQEVGASEEEAAKKLLDRVA